MVTKKKFLAIIYVINKFKHYITGYPIFLHIDHSTIMYLINKPITNRKITRWFILLQEFDITIFYKPGKDNVVADFLSRITNNSDDSPVEDSFLDDHLFVVSTHPPWYAYIANYLAIGELPHHLTLR